MLRIRPPTAIFTHARSIASSLLGSTCAMCVLMYIPSSTGNWTVINLRRLKGTNYYIFTFYELSERPLFSVCCVRLVGDLGLGRGRELNDENIYAQNKCKTGSTESQNDAKNSIYLGFCLMGLDSVYGAHAILFYFLWCQ